MGWMVSLVLEAEGEKRWMPSSAANWTKRLEVGLAP